ncbi:MAG: 16S rRNA (uracil(1498)-N(3))-methyltransferase [Clostridia bacterium]|nr:16S rRNA (uracil(1498)-N(3))-methyltransferase [Clostridia bacterium]
MPHFFVNPEDISESTLTIKGEDAHHISYALRMAVGEEISVCDGKGLIYHCRLSQMDGTEVKADILSFATAKTELPVPIHLYQAYPKSDKLEFIIQKAVELGAYQIIPFESSRCIKRPKSDKIDRIVLRQNRIAQEAAKQCARAILPKVLPPISFSAMLNDIQKHSLVLFCYEGEGTAFIRDILSSVSLPSSVALIIGSEGGFSPEEADAIKKAGGTMTGLGGRILRCETASLYALSVLSSFLEPKD